MPEADKPKPSKRITDVFVRSAKAGRHSVGQGLILDVAESGARKWVLRVVVRGKRRDIGLGGYPGVTLADARTKAAEMRFEARKGGDPLGARRKEQAIPTFEEAARTVFEERSPGWRNPVHRAQWIKSLEDHAFPVMGGVRVSDVGNGEVKDVLTPIWLARPETARRVKQRIGVVIDWAYAKGFRRGENPVRAIVQGLPKHNEPRGHHASMPYADVPRFIERLRASPGSSSTKRAFEFLILTASRSGEVRGATWSEIDLEKCVWTIPKERMKAKAEHKIPLSDRAIELLQVQRVEAGKSDFVFSGRFGKPLSHVAFQKYLAKLEEPFTPHGFRSSFRDWAAERTPYPREVAEAALAHTVKDKAERAYRRTDFLEQRRGLMAAWSAWSEPKPANVIPIRRESA